METEVCAVPLYDPSVSVPVEGHFNTMAYTAPDLLVYLQIAKSANQGSVSAWSFVINHQPVSDT